MRYPLYRTLFVIFFFGEVLLLSSERVQYLGIRENAIVQILLATLMGVLAMRASLEKRTPGIQPIAAGWENRIMYVLSGLGLMLCAARFYHEISHFPIDFHTSDIIPTIQVMNQRFLHGQYPYSLIQDFGYDLNPTYLPLMWMPFLPAVLFQFDPRWMAFGIWALATSLFLYRVHIAQLSSEAKWFVMAVPFFLFTLLTNTNLALLGNTVELMIAGFYLLFALQLADIRTYLSGPAFKRAAWMAVFILLCLLSRYSFILWLPLAFGVIWMERRSLALYTAASVLTGVLVLFVLPFLLKDPMMYFNGLKYYATAALAIWDQPGKTGPLYEGIGLASIFRDSGSGEMAARLASLQLWQLLGSLSVVIFAALYWWKKRTQIQDPSLFLLGSLKAYFALFYGFIQVPYQYLMLPPCFLGVAMLLVWYRKNQPEG